MEYFIDQKEVKMIQIMNNGKVRVDCPNGHTTTTYLGDDWEYSSVCEETADCRMGNKVEHIYKLEGMCCSICGREIFAEISVTEYPEGCMEGGVDHSQNVNATDAESSVVITLME